MALIAADLGKKLRGMAGISALIFFLFGAALAQAESISVFAVGAGFPSELYRFNEDGTLEETRVLPDSHFGISLATVDTSLYIGVFGGAVNRYDLSGDFLGRFADVSGMAGPSPNLQLLDSDSAGNVYATFLGQSSMPRTSFRLDPDGAISETFSHASLVFPRGIDATSGGDVYIVNGALAGVGNRLFWFGSDGAYINDFPIPEVVGPSDIAIDEVDEDLYIADEGGQAIVVYDISTGAPIFSHTLPAPGRATDVFVEPISGRIFGMSYDPAGLPLRSTGFEVSRDGDVVNLYSFASAPTGPSGLTFLSIVAVATEVPLDHYLCYKVKVKRGTPKFQPVSVTLEDRFGVTEGTVEKPVRLCNPVDKNSEGINDPTAHLTCYKVKREPGVPDLPETLVETEDQFGQLTLKVGSKSKGKASRKEKKAKATSTTLCVPSEKDGVPSNLNVDHFQLHKAKRPRGTSMFQRVLVDLEDQFGTLSDVKVRKPETLGTPTDKNGEGILNEAKHLTCYSIKLARGTSKLPDREVEADDQFGHLTLQLKSKPKTLCVPSVGTVVE